MILAMALTKTGNWKFQKLYFKFIDTKCNIRKMILAMALTKKGNCKFQKLYFKFIVTKYNQEADSCNGVDQKR